MSEPTSHMEDMSLVLLPDSQPGYDKALNGPGRWCVLQAPIGVDAGILYTDDHHVLGFLDTDRGQALAGTLRVTLMALAEAGMSATQAFDALVSRADTAALYSLSIRAGDLESLRV